MIEKLSVIAFGANEWSLRLIPYLASIVSLVLFYWLAKRSVSESAVPIAVGLFAFGEPLIYYASEVKQYASDVTFTIMVVLLTLAIAERDGPSPAWVGAYGLAGAVAVWFSHPAVFVLAACGLTLAWMWRGSRQKYVWLGVIAAVWLSNMIAVYLVNLKPLAANQRMLTFWASEFMPLPPRSLSDLGWLPRHLMELFHNPVGLSSSGIGLLAFIVGCVALYRQRRGLLPITGLILAFVLAASALHKYPFMGRLLLFLVPCLVLVIAEGASAMLRGGDGMITVAGAVVVAILLLHPAAVATVNLVRPRYHEEVRPLLDYYQKAKRDGDVLYLYYGAQPAFDFYRNEPGNGELIRGTESRDDLSRYAVEAKGLRGHRRVWLLFSHVYRDNGVDEEKHFLHALDEIGKRVETRTTTGASLYLYQLAAE
jgi:4-amino-4-deoxy-L-arabinose transferase-like glycosyltransferase